MRARSLSAVPVALGSELSLSDVMQVARGERVELRGDAAERMRASRAVVERAVASDETVYGVTTGFGSLAQVRIAPERAAELQAGIVRSHAVAVGAPLSEEETRAMLLLRAHVLALGYSGVRVELVERMVEMLNRNLLPVVPEQGSLGASGDLAPLAHLSLPLIGLGEMHGRDGRREPAANVLDRADLGPLSLEAKEGLALVNGTQGMLAIGIVAADRLSRLVKLADVAAAMSVEAALGTDKPFEERLHRLRPHHGQSVSAANLRTLMAGSEIVASHRDSGHLVQDAYSLRCAPQVHGATRDVLAFATGVLGTESNSVSDNPVVFSDDGDLASGGNFHGQPVGTALDALALAVVPMASVSERRLYRLLDPSLNNGLPPFLVGESGVNSGLMLAQYTAASLVSESKSIAHPASVDSIPSSAGQEDHVSMGMTSARHLRSVVANAEIVLALELLGAAQALDLREGLRPGEGSRAARDAIRERVPFLEADRELRVDIDDVVELVRGAVLLERVEDAVGELH